MSDGHEEIIVGDGEYAMVGLSKREVDALQQYLQSMQFSGGTD